MAIEPVERRKILYGVVFLARLTLLYLHIGNSRPFLMPSDNSGLHKSIKEFYNALEEEIRSRSLSFSIFSLIGGLHVGVDFPAWCTTSTHGTTVTRRGEDPARTQGAHSASY